MTGAAMPLDVRKACGLPSRCLTRWAMPGSGVALELSRDGRKGRALPHIRRPSRTSTAPPALILPHTGSVLFVKRKDKLLLR